MKTLPLLESWWGTRKVQTCCSLGCGLVPPCLGMPQEKPVLETMLVLTQILFPCGLWAPLSLDCCFSALSAEMWRVLWASRCSLVLQETLKQRAELFQDRGENLTLSSPGFFCYWGKRLFYIVSLPDFPLIMLICLPRDSYGHLLLRKET